MSEDDKITIEVDKDNVKHQLAKLVIGTAVGFIATKLAESAYEHFVENRNRPIVETKD